MFKVGEEVDNLGLRWKCKVCGCDNVKIIHQIKDEYNVECINPKCKNKENFKYSHGLIIPKQFSKSDLRDHMEVVLRNGDKGIVWKENIFITVKEDVIFNNYVIKTFQYDDELLVNKKLYESKADIMQVTYNDEVVFNRDEEQEPTVEQRLDFDNTVSDLLSEYYETGELEVLVKVGQTIIDFIDKHYELEDEEEIRPEGSL